MVYMRIVLMSPTGLHGGVWEKLDPGQVAEVENGIMAALEAKKTIRLRATEDANRYFAADTLLFIEVQTHFGDEPPPPEPKEEVTPVLPSVEGLSEEYRRHWSYEEMNDSCEAAAVLALEMVRRAVNPPG